jgi:putative Holliday junction resolvase
MSYIEAKNSTRILALDYGEKRVGLAISDIMKIIAKPFKTLPNNSDKSIINELKKIIFDKSIEKIVVGLPITMSNQESKQTKTVSQFINKLKTAVDVPVISYDERLTSIEAKRSLISQGIKTGHNKGAVDMTAAAIFLQNHLDER